LKNPKGEKRRRGGKNDIKDRRVTPKGKKRLEYLEIQMQ